MKTAAVKIRVLLYTVKINTIALKLIWTQTRQCYDGHKSRREKLVGLEVRLHRYNIAFIELSLLQIQTSRTWQEMGRTGTIYNIMTSKEVEYE